MRCRMDRLAPLPWAEDPPSPECRLGEECDVSVVMKRGESPVLECLVEALESRSAPRRRDAMTALAAVGAFSRTPPRHRTARNVAWARLGKRKVRQETRVAEPLWKFGIGRGTRVRVFGVDVDDDHPHVALFFVDVKKALDDWSGVRSALLAIREGGVP